MSTLFRFALILLITSGVCAFTTTFTSQPRQLTTVQSQNGLQMLFGTKKATKKAATGFAITVEQKGFKPTDFVVEGGPVNLRKKLLEEKVDLYPLQGKLYNCGGGAQCGTCAVAVLSGDKNLNPKTPVEKKLLEKKPDNFRLACCTRASGDCTIKTKP